MNGRVDEALELFKKADLPHNTPRQRLELVLAGMSKLTDQIGSHDYVLIGEVYGSGNAFANQSTLTQALCKKAARKGGDVVLVHYRATIKKPYQYTVPGYSTTNASATAYSYGDSATAYGTSTTSYTPSQTYSGVFYKPTASAWVFRYAPGEWKADQALRSLGNEQLSRAMNRLKALGQDRKLTWDDGFKRAVRIANGD